MASPTMPVQMNDFLICAPAIGAAMIIFSFFSGRFLELAATGLLYLVLGIFVRCCWITDEDELVRFIETLPAPLQMIIVIICFITRTSFNIGTGLLKLGLAQSSARIPSLVRQSITALSDAVSSCLAGMFASCLRPFFEHIDPLLDALELIGEPRVQKLDEALVKWARFELAALALGYATGDSASSAHNSSTTGDSNNPDGSDPSGTATTNTSNSPRNGTPTPERSDTDKAPTNANAAVQTVQTVVQNVHVAVQTIDATVQTAEAAVQTVDTPPAAATVQFANAAVQTMDTPPAANQAEEAERATSDIHSTIPEGQHDSTPPSRVLTAAPPSVSARVSAATPDAAAGHVSAAPTTTAKDNGSRSQRHQHSTQHGSQAQSGVALPASEHHNLAQQPAEGSGQSDLPADEGADAPEADQDDDEDGDWEDEVAEQMFTDNMYRHYFRDHIGAGGNGGVRLWGPPGGEPTAVVKSMLVAVRILEDGRPEGVVAYKRRVRAISWGIKREWRALQQLKHRNIVEALGYHQDTNGLTRHIKLERLDGDLSSLLYNHHAQRPHLSDEGICHAISDITKGLQHMHDMGYLHRDLKAANVLVKKGGHMTGTIEERDLYKVADLGWASREHGPNGLRDRQLATPGMYPPEVEASGLVTDKVDTWAVGVILAEMFGLVPEGLYEGETNADRAALLSRLAKSDPRLSIFADFLEVDPALRVSARQACARFELLLLLPGDDKFPADWASRQRRNHAWAEWLLENLENSPQDDVMTFLHLLDGQDPLEALMFPRGSEAYRRLRAVRLNTLEDTRPVDALPQPAPVAVEVQPRRDSPRPALFGAPQGVVQRQQGSFDRRNPFRARHNNQVATNNGGPRALQDLMEGSEPIEEPQQRQSEGHEVRRVPAPIMAPARAATPFVPPPGLAAEPLIPGLAAAAEPLIPGLPAAAVPPPPGLAAWCLFVPLQRH